MKKAILPKDEDLRLKDLYAYDILDTEKELDFDDLVALVAQICQCPMASITFIDQDRQWFKSEINMKSREGARDTSFCGHTILQKDMLVVNDALADERFFDNLLVVGGLKIRFYAGAPITSSSGYRLGSVCVIDKIPHELSGEQLQAVERVARQVSRLLDLRLRNRQLKQASDRLIQSEKKVARLNLMSRELENFQTAHSLHEDIAQMLTAVKLYVGMASGADADSQLYLNKAAKELNEITVRITDLSKGIVPTTLENGDYTDYIRNLAIRQIDGKGCILDFKIEGTHEKLRGYFGLMVFRIVQDLLQLAGYTTKASLNIYASDNINIDYFFHRSDSMPREEEKMTASNIGNRVELLQGSMKVDTKKQLQRYRISLPLAVMQMAEAN